VCIGIVALGVGVAVVAGSNVGVGTAVGAGVAVGDGRQTPASGCAICRSSFVSAASMQCVKSGHAVAKTLPDRSRQRSRVAPPSVRVGSIEQVTLPLSRKDLMHGTGFREIGMPQVDSASMLLTYDLHRGRRRSSPTASNSWRRTHRM
jgi:hypothetical protein